MNKVIEVVSAIILNENNEILVTQRGYGPNKGYFEFPGGKIEPHETKEEALKRELKEELDAKIEILDFLNTIDYDYETFHLTMHNFICHLVDNHIILKEHLSKEYVNVNDIEKVNFLPADKLIFAPLKAYIAKISK